MKKLILFLLLAVGLIGSASASVLTTLSDFTPEGSQSDYSLTLDNSRLINGSPSIKINMLNGYGASWAQATLNTTSPITGISYYQYDEFGVNSPFYNYLGFGPAPTFAWQDAGLGGRIALYSDSNYIPSLARTIGWHKVDVILDGRAINYSIDNILVSRWISNVEISPIYQIGFNISSAGGGSYSYNISQVIVNPEFTAIPEPSTYALFGIGAIGMLMVLRRKKTA
jgi:hypothetical protein